MRYLLGERAKTKGETVKGDMNAERPHHPEETPVSVCLHEAHVRILCRQSVPMA